MFVHIQLGAGVSPHRVCVSRAQPPLWRGPWDRCDSAEGSPCDVLVSACVVCRLERFARYLGRREGGRTGGGGWRQEAALVSSLSSLANWRWRGRGGGHPFLPLPMGAIIHYHLSQSEKHEIKLHHRWMLTAYGYPTTPSFQFKDWTGLPFNHRVLQALELAKAVCERVRKVQRTIWHWLK